MRDWNLLLDQQRQLEEESLSAGMKRFRDRVLIADQKGQGSRAGGKRSLLAHGVVVLEEAIKEWLEGQEATVGRRHTSYPWIKQVGAEVSAFMVLKVALDTLATKGGTGQTIRHLAFAVSHLMVDELKWRRFREEAPELFAYKMRKFQTSSYSYMARSLHHALVQWAEVDVSDLEMSHRDRLLVGGKLLDLLMSATGLVEVDTRVIPGSNGRTMRTEQVLVPTEDAQLWIMERERALEVLYPVNLPMVVPPLPWGPGQRGGYRFALREKHPLVRGTSRDHERAVSRSRMPVVYEALNRVQETAWRINPHVLGLVEEIVGLGGGIAGVPLLDEEEMPNRPYDIDENEESRRGWRKAAHLVKERNHRRRCDALSFAKIMSVVRSLQEKDAFWFPHNLDFRGRLYPITAYLNPQGDDLSRGLLRFAEGKPLGPTGAKWLALHLANCLGETPEGQKVSRMTLEERVQWVQRNTDRIVQVAEGPLGDPLLRSAEKPFQFYAACVEWHRYVEEGESYVCSLPCAMDGSCNGLQHFAALFLDPQAARAVNVVPARVPQDVYSDVAEAVLDRLTGLAAMGTEEEQALAVRWLSTGLVDRKLCKRPTMTFGYGSKQYGFRSQIIEYLQGLDGWKEEVEALFLDGEVSYVGPAASLMSRLIWEALETVVPAAFTGMDWMQTAARAVVRSGRCVEWSVPATGFLVRQEYFKADRRRVETMLAGQVWKPSIYVQTDEVDPVRQANGVAPNFVHSLDAAALMLTVQQASHEGLEFFGMVHDSYATLPADCEVLARVTRQAFVSLYQRHDVIGTLRGALEEASDEEVPEAPAKGDLDISLVLASQYFFS